MFVYRIKERWDGKVVGIFSQYYDRVYTRAFASRIAKKLFLKNRPDKLTETELNTIANEPYLGKRGKRRYQVLVIYDDRENTRARNGEVVEVWDSTYGRRGRRLSVQERKEEFPFTRKDIDY